MEIKETLKVAIELSDEDAIQALYDVGKISLHDMMFSMIVIGSYDKIELSLINEELIDELYDHVIKTDDNKLKKWMQNTFIKRK